MDLAQQIFVRMQHVMKIKQAEFNLAVGKLAGLNPLSILSRGYSITFKLPENSVIKETRLIKTGDTIKTRLHRGEILSKVTEVNKDGGNKI